MTTATKKARQEKPKEVDPGRGSLDYRQVLGRTGETDELYKQFTWEQLLDGKPFPTLWEELAPILRAAQRAAEGKLPYKHEIKHLKECITALLVPLPYKQREWTKDRELVPREDALGPNDQYPIFRLTLSTRPDISLPDTDRSESDTPSQPADSLPEDSVTL